MASSYSVSWNAFMDGTPNAVEKLEVTYEITAHTDGSVTAISTNTDTIIDGRTYTQLVRGRSLYAVEAYPTSGGTAPDAADVTVTQNGLDVLSGNGVNLIHATDTRATYPAVDGEPMPVPVSGALTINIANQATNAADFTVRLKFQG